MWLRRTWLGLALVSVACQASSGAERQRDDEGAGEGGEAGRGGAGAGRAGSGASGSGGAASGGALNGEAGIAGNEGGAPSAAGTNAAGTGAAGASGAADEVAGEGGEGGARAGDGGSGGSGGAGSGTSGQGGAAAGAGGLGGTGASAGEGGSGCTGGLEELANGICTPAMAGVPSDNGEFFIDRTEVTRGQYQSWLATQPSPFPVVITVCSLNSSYEPDESCVLPEVAGADRHPMTCVDWCDARFYCAAVGKRLCGYTTGGPAPYARDDYDYHRDQWGLACSSGGDRIFTYDEPYDANACNSESAGTLPVASLATCQSTEPEYVGIYDMNGNVREWLDQCSPDNSSPTCYARGGAFDMGSVGCSSFGYGSHRTTASPNLGFRCCSK